MNQSEPTTGEIVSALRNCPNCDDCLRKDQKCYRNDHDAADRLESQAREIEQLKKANQFGGDMIDKQEKEIAALTARAESAERERDAAFDMLQDMRNCDECKHLARTWKEEPCNCCCREYSMFELCGLPQDGEGK